MSIKPSTPSPISVLSTSCYRLEAPAVAEAPPPVSLRATEPRYSIRLAESPGTPCAQCIEPTGAGPVGYLDEEPVCDRCLLHNCAELGMVIAVIAVTRDYGAFEPQSEAEWLAALAELGAFARIYERFALRSGPRRRILDLGDPEDGPVH